MLRSFYSMGTCIRRQKFWQNFQAKVFFEISGKGNVGVDGATQKHFARFFWPNLNCYKTFLVHQNLLGESRGWDEVAKGSG